MVNRTSNIVNSIIESNAINFAQERNFYISDNVDLEEFQSKREDVNNILQSLRDSHVAFPHYDGLVIASDSSFLWKDNDNVNVAVASLSTSDGNILSVDMKAHINKIDNNNHSEYYSLASALKYALECTGEDVQEITLTCDSYYAIDRLYDERSYIMKNNREGKNISIRYVKGHSHDYLNNTSDIMANYHANNLRSWLNNNMNKETCRKKNSVLRKALRREIIRMRAMSENSSVKFLYN